MTDPTLTASRLRLQVQQQLQEAGVPSAHSDASRLVAAALEVPPGYIPLAPQPTAEQLDLIRGWATRRCTREPLQHILGTAAFADLELAVGPGVFVPRPETEVLFSLALQRLPTGSSAPTIVDLCAGSGAIALSIALAVPGACVYAVEKSNAAVTWLRTNVVAHTNDLAAINSTVRVVAADATADPLPNLHAAVDLVATNPPYIPEGCVPRDPEVRLYDPPEALFGGEDGLDVVRGVLRTAAHLLRPGGSVLVEHGDAQGWGQSASVPQLLQVSGAFSDVLDHEDLTGRPRVSTAVRSPQGQSVLETA